MSTYIQDRYISEVGLLNAPQLPQLDHILYGTARLFAGNLCFISRDGGKRGEALRYSITVGTELSITRAQRRLMITLAPDTTEQQLLDFLNTAPEFRKLAIALPTGGDGSQAAPIVGTVQAPAAPMAAAEGLRQHLEARLSLHGWNDRELVASGAPQSLLWIGKCEEEASRIDGEGADRWSGEVNAGIAFSIGTSFEDENALLIRYRRLLQQAGKQFAHVGLTNLGPFKFGFTNITKDEETGTDLPDAHIRVVGSFQILWRELPSDPEDEKTYPISEIQFGIWREPDDDTPGPEGHENLDATVRYDPTNGWTVDPVLTD